MALTAIAHLPGQDGTSRNNIDHASLYKNINKQYYSIMFNFIRWPPTNAFRCRNAIEEASSFLAGTTKLAVAPTVATDCNAGEDASSLLTGSPSQWWRLQGWLRPTRPSRVSAERLPQQDFCESIDAIDLVLVSLVGLIQQILDKKQKQRKIGKVKWSSIVIVDISFKLLSQSIL